MEKPEDDEVGKRNIETMEKLVEEMKKDGDYVGDAVKKVKSKKVKSK